MERRSVKKILGNIGVCILIVVALVVTVFEPRQIDDFLNVHVPWLNTVLGIVLGLGIIWLMARAWRRGRRRKQGRPEA